MLLDDLRHIKIMTSWLYRFVPRLGRVFAAHRAVASINMVLYEYDSEFVRFVGGFYQEKVIALEAVVAEVLYDFLSAFVVAARVFRACTRACAFAEMHHKTGVRRRVALHQMRTKLVLLLKAAEHTFARVARRVRGEYRHVAEVAARHIKPKIALFVGVIKKVESGAFRYLRLIVLWLNLLYFLAF